MKKNVLIASAAVLSALGSLGLGHFYFDRLEQEVSGGPPVPVLIAQEDVPVGTPLNEDSLGIREIPKAWVEDRHVLAKDLEKILGARVSGGLHAGETLQWNDLSQFSEQGRNLSGLVTQGMRAVTVSGKDVSFGGLLRPGDRVDVLLTTHGVSGGSSTRTLLQNLMVLAVGTDIERPSEKKTRVRGGRSVTLNVTAEGAQLIAQAREAGLLSLTLRNSADLTVVEGLLETTAKEISHNQVTKISSAKTTKPSRPGIERVR